MNQELSTSLVCVVLRGDIELWLPKEREKELEHALADKNKTFIRINGQLVNRYEISGVFDAKHMEERTRRKNGEWKCQKGTWHQKNQSCSCRDYTEEVTAFVEGVGEVKYKR